MVCLVKCVGFYIREAWNHWWHSISRFAQKPLWGWLFASVWDHIFCSVVFSVSLNIAAQQSKFKLHWKILNGMICLVKWRVLHQGSMKSLMARNVTVCTKAFLRLVIMWQCADHSMHILHHRSQYSCHTVHVTQFACHMLKNAHHNIYIRECTP